MKRIGCNTMTILLASFLLAGPALGNGGPSVSDTSSGAATGKNSPSMSESTTRGDSSAKPVTGKDSPSISESTTRGDSSARPATGKDSSSMSESKTSYDSSVSSSAQKSKNSRVASSSLNQDQIRELQRQLNDQGYPAGNVDGIIGPRTTSAIRQFQTANELSVTGTADQSTLRELAPDAQKQEFFGVAPAYGEGTKEQNQPAKSMEQPMKYDSGKQVDQPMKNQVEKKAYQPMDKDPEKSMEQPMKKGY